MIDVDLFKTQSLGPARGELLSDSDCDYDENSDDNKAMKMASMI